MKHLDTKYVVGAIIALFIVAGGSFYGGMTYANNVRASARASFTGGQFAGGAGSAGRRAGGGAAAGSIIAKDAISLTIKSQDGSTKIVLTGSTTQVMKTASGTLNDLSVGNNVIVTGTTNADGSVTAQTVSIRPAMPAAPTASPQPAQ